MARTVNYLGMTGTVLLNCPIKAEIRAVDSQSFDNFVIVMITIVRENRESGHISEIANYSYPRLNYS